MAVALHIAVGGGAFRHFRRGPSSLARVWPGAVERLDLGFLVERPHHCVGRRGYVKAEDAVQRLDEGGIVGRLEVPSAVGPPAVSLLDVLATTVPTVFAIAPTVQRIASCGGVVGAGRIALAIAASSGYDV